MKTHVRFLNTLYRVALWTGCMGIVLSGIPSAYAGKGEGRIKPPAEAQALLSRFQQTLRDSQWDKALSLCSDRVRAGACSYPSAEMLFQDVVPVKAVVALDSFPMSSYTIIADPAGQPESDRLTRIGQFVQISQAEPRPAIDWCWTLFRLDTRWIMDFDPMPLSDVKERETQRLRKAAADLALVDHVVTGVTTRLTPLNQTYTVGQPTLLRLELTNGSDLDLVYEHSQVALNDPLIVTDARGERIPYAAGPVQTTLRLGRVHKGGTVVLFDGLDLGRQYGVTQTGRYKVQFSGKGLTVGIAALGGQQSPEDWPSHTSSKSFPSNVVEIEVQPAAAQ